MSKRDTATAAAVVQGRAVVANSFLEIESGPWPCEQNPLSGVLFGNFISSCSLQYAYT